MERWTGRVAVVTGASAGIGAAICAVLVEAGMKVVGAARNVAKIKALSDSLASAPGSLMGVSCDISKDEDVVKLFSFIKKNYGGVDVCINNAGMSRDTCLLAGTPTEWREMLNVNVVGLCHLTKLSVASMRERGVDDGQVVHISSICAYQVFNALPEAHFYSATKYAVRALTEGLRQELRDANSHIRVSSVSPGMVQTEFLQRMKNMSDEESIAVYNEIGGGSCLTGGDIANSVKYILSQPPHVEINDIIVRPTPSKI